MGRVLTNNVGVAYSIESALGVAGTTWKQLEPNDIPAMGAEITTVARSPISRSRQRRKGTITDLDSTVEIEHDLTMSVFRDFVEGFAFARGVNSDVTELAAASATTGPNTYAGLTALVVAQAPKFNINSLLWVTGGASQNNGLKSVSVAAATTNTTLTVNETLVAETAAIRLSFAGRRIPSASTPTWDWDGTNRIATLASTGLGTALALLGLTVGQMVHVGSIATLGGAVQNAFQNALANDMYGYARVRSISANAVVFDKVAARLQFDDLTAPATPVDLVFGEFIRNVPVGNADYLERSFQFEASFPNLGTAGAENYEYAIGNFCNEVSFELPLADKATASFNFIGTDTEPTTAVRKSGASAAALPLRTAALNTSADLARLRINRVDDTGLTTDFKSITLTLNNNVSPEKVLGKLGARFMNTGNFEVDVEAQVLFSSPDVTAAIRQNTTVTMDFILQNDDGAIAVDLPSITLGGGDREFPANESVLMNVNTQAFADPVLNTSIGVSLFPVPLRSGEIT